MNASAPLSLRPRAPSPAEVHYPSSDGWPMADNDAQWAVITYAGGALRIRYHLDLTVYVTADLLMYYEEGNPKASVARDVMVVFGAENKKRQSYKLWSEPKGPDFVLEVASARTWRDDEGPKRELCARLGVTEYWQFDPTGELLDAALKGGCLRGGEYEPTRVEETADGRLAGYSEVLGLELWGRGDEMRFRDRETGLDLPSHLEEQVARQAAEVRAEREADARQAAEARVAELEALLR